MNLYELQKEYKIVLANIDFLNKKIRNERETMQSPKTVKLDKILVGGSAPRSDLSDGVSKIVDWENEINKLERELSEYKPFIDELEAILKEFNDRDQLIYLEYHLKGYTAILIGHRYGITDSMVYKILKKVEKSLRDSKIFQ